MLSTVFVLAIFAVSCKKDISGCTDPYSDNHNVLAGVEDGSCNYHGYLSSWYNNVTRDSLLANNIDSLTVFVDNQTFASFNPTSAQWSAEPECSSMIGNWITMPATQTRSISLIVQGFDDSDNVVRQWTETLEIQRDSCELYEIIW